MMFKWPSLTIILDKTILKSEMGTKYGLMCLDLKYLEGGVQPPVSPGVTRKQHNKGPAASKIFA